MKTHPLSFVSVSVGLLLYWGSWVGVVRAAASAADSTGDEGLRKVLLRQAGTGAISNAADGLQKYLALPIGDNVAVGGGRTTRLGALARLSLETNVLTELRGHWPAITNAAQRTELAEMIGRFVQVPAGAAMLVELLRDPAEQVRFEAVHGLRLMSMRVDRSGGQRNQRGLEHPPKVAGLVASLISAANDASEGIRVHALFALADTRDDQAARAIRKHLDDPSAKVRMHAACFLTEFGDDAGLPELKAGLERLHAIQPQADFMYFEEAEMLLASLQRLTARNFGEIPLVPGLHSDTTQGEAARKQYLRLLDSWWNYLATSPAK